MKQLKVLTIFLMFSFVLVLALSAQQKTDETVTCVVGGKEMKKSEVKITHEYKEKTYYFCCAKCKEAFIKNPEKYTQKKADMKEVYTCPMHPDVKSDKPGKCSKCGMKLVKKMMQMKHMHGEEQKKHMHGEEQEPGHMMKMKAKEHMKQMKAKEKPCCPMMGMMSSKDIEMKVENLKDGVAVKVTSKNADVVKKIQEMAAKMKTMCSQKEGCCKVETKKEKVKK
jgi:YHS domain-containing protein